MHVVYSFSASMPCNGQPPTGRAKILCFKIPFDIVMEVNVTGWGTA